MRFLPRVWSRQQTFDGTGDAGDHAVPNVRRGEIVAENIHAGICLEEQHRTGFIDIAVDAEIIEPKPSAHFTKYRRQVRTLFLIKGCKPDPLLFFAVRGSTASAQEPI